MINTSNEYKEFIKEDRKFSMKANITFEDGRTFNVDDPLIFQNGMSFDDATSGMHELQIGSAIIGKHKLTLDNTNGDFDEYEFLNAEIVPFVGLKLSETTEYLKKGVYTVDDYSFQGNIINLDCLDNMHKFGRDFSEVNISFPTTALVLLQAISTHCGVSLATTEFTNHDFVIQKRPDNSALSCLDIVAYIAQLGGNFARINRDGALELKWYDLSAFEDTENPGKYHDFDFFPSTPTIAIDDVVITGVYVENTIDYEGEYFVPFGLQGYVLKISNNPLIQSEEDAITVADSVGPKIVGMRFRPFHARTLSDPSVEAGDPCHITVRTNKGLTTYQSFITMMSFTVGQSQSIECGAETVSRKNSTAYSAQTKTVIQARNQARKEITAYDLAVQQLTSLMANSFGTFKSEEVQEDGSKIFYMHDKPTVAESQTIWKMTANTFTVSTDSGVTWGAGFDSSGNAVMNVLHAIGVNADWVRTGVLMSQDGSTWINLNDGTFNLGDNIRLDEEGFFLRVSDEMQDNIEKSVKLTEAEYYLSDSTTELIGGFWGITAPPWVNGKYMWTRNKVTLNNGTVIYVPSENGTCIAGAKGQDGTPGQDGTDGQTTYTWIMYANDALGNGISDTPEDKRYVGIATNKLTPNKSVTPSDYEWSPLYDNVEIGGENRLFESKLNVEFFDGDVGRNLIQGTSKEWKPTSLTSWNKYPYNSIAVEPEETYTFTIEYRNPVGIKFTTKIFEYDKDRNLTESGDGTFVEIGEQGYSTITITTLPTTAEIRCGIRAYRAEGGNVEYRHAKLEKGDTPTPWTPAPEDVGNVQKVELIRDTNKPYYKVFNPYSNFISLSSAFANSRFAEPLESLGRVTISLDVMVEVDREITINNSTFVVPGNRWTKIFFTKEFTENTTRNIRVYTPYSRKRKVVTEVGTKLIDSLVTDINTLYYRNLQVERGNVPTDYSLTPEELQRTVDSHSTQIKQLQDSISLVATRNQNTGRFEVTPQSIVQAIDSTDGVGRVKTTKVTVDENGLTVDDGAILIRDSNNQSLITSNGLRAMHIITSSGELNGWQPAGIWDLYGTVSRKTATINMHIPKDLIIETAQLYVRSMPSYQTGNSSVPDGFYHPRNLRLYEGDVNDGALDLPYESNYYVVFGRSERNDITNHVWGNSWTPTGQGIKERVADVKNYIHSGKGITFLVETTDAASPANARYVGVMQLELVVTGFLRG